MRLFTIILVALLLAIWIPAYSQAEATTARPTIGPTIMVIPFAKEEEQLRSILENDAALRVAVDELQWSAQARTRIAFLLLDAPPHEDRQVMEEYRELVKSAAAKGIRIVPVTASGIDKATEFLMRQTAIATNGTYVFITNDSGIGNDHLEATVGDYEVEFLNDLLVRLVGEYTE